MAHVSKVTIVLVFCSSFVECRKDKVFCVICEIGLEANKPQIIHNFARFVIHDIVSCFGLSADTSSLDGVPCNSFRTPLLKH